MNEMDPMSHEKHPSSIRHVENLQGTYLKLVDNRCIEAPDDRERAPDTRPYDQRRDFSGTFAFH